MSELLLPETKTSTTALLREALQLCRKLEEKLREMEPQPAMPPLSESLKARMASLFDLEDACDEGKLEEYRGEHLIVGDGVILVHGKDLRKLRKQANTKAKKEGIPLDHLLEFYVDSLE